MSPGRTKCDISRTTFCPDVTWKNKCDIIKNHLLHWCHLEEQNVTLSRNTFCTDVTWKNKCDITKNHLLHWCHLEEQNVTLSRTTFSTDVTWKNKMWHYQEPPSPLVSSRRTKCDIVKNHLLYWFLLEEQNVTLLRKNHLLHWCQLEEQDVILLRENPLLHWYQLEEQNVTLSRTTIPTGVTWRNKMWHHQKPPSPLVSSGRTKCGIFKNHLLHRCHLEEQNVTLSTTTFSTGGIWQNKMWHYQQPPSPLVSSVRTKCDIINNHLLHWCHLKEQIVTSSRTIFSTDVTWKNKMWHYQEPPSPLVSSGRTKCDIIKNHLLHLCHL